VAFAAASNVLSAVRAGKIKAYAVTSNARWAAAPENPTVDVAGCPPQSLLFVTMSLSFPNWSNHGQEEIEATRMDPRRRSRIEKPRQAEDLGNKDC
jgi:hypothetical protein